MKWQRRELVGRRAELDALHRHSGAPELLVVRGPESSGRTALLRRFGTESDRVVLDLGGRDGGPAWDEFRVRALLCAVRADFEVLGTGARVADAVDAVSRLCVPRSYVTPGGRHRLLGAVGVLLGRITVSTVIVVDDADEVPVSALASMHRAGHTVLAACGTVGSRDLCSLADLVVDLAALTDDEVGRLLWQVAAAPVDEAVPRALRENLGPLYGNPGTLVSTVESLVVEGRLAKVHGVLALRAPRAPIALPAGHRLLAELDELGRALVRLAAASDLSVDQLPALAEDTGHTVHDYGNAVDRLVRAGVLVQEADGRLRCAARAVAAAVAEPLRPPAPAGRTLSESVRQLISSGDYERLAEFVTAEITTGRLDLPAEKRCLARRERSTRTTGALDSRVGPRGVGSRGVGGGVFDGAGERDELAAASALAAMHTGRAVPEVVRGVVGGPALELADRWFAGAELEVEDVSESLAPLRRRGRRGDGVAGGGYVDGRDLVPVLRSVLGPLYRPAADGPVAAYHRVSRGYADGDWADAMSAARELELMSGVDTPLVDAARLLTAEICRWRGEYRQAASWLAAVGENTLFPGLRGWVDTGLREHDSDDDAFAHGWAWYTAHAARLEEPGAARLLVRLATIAVDAGDRYRARSVLRALRTRYGAGSPPCLLVRGLVEGDAACLRAAERAIRVRGTRFELVFACQRMAGLVDEPRQWLDEAYELARSIGATRLVSSTRRTMAGCGVAAPVRRTRHVDAPAVSDVERQIVELIRLGRTNRQIALALGVSAKTVEKHLTRVFAKAGCRTRHGLAMSGFGARPEPVGA